MQALSFGNVQLDGSVFLKTHKMKHVNLIAALLASQLGVQFEITDSVIASIPIDVFRCSAVRPSSRPAQCFLYEGIKFHKVDSVGGASKPARNEFYGLGG